MLIGHFTAFYPSRPFWAVEKIDLTDPKVLQNFSSLMEEEVFEYSDDAFSIKICRDGMVKLRIEALKSNGAQQAFEYTVKRRGEYLDYLNHNDALGVL